MILKRIHKKGFTLIECSISLALAATFLIYSYNILENSNVIKIKEDIDLEQHLIGIGIVEIISMYDIDSYGFYVQFNNLDEFIEGLRSKNYCDELNIDNITFEKRYIALIEGEAFNNIEKINISLYCRGKEHLIINYYGAIK